MGIGEHERPNKGATDEWLTPLAIVRALGNFNLDPCASLGHDTARLKLFNRGLDVEWGQARVWLNPPYSEVGIWLGKLAYHGRGVALVFARTDTVWAQKYMPLATSVFFPAKRIRFLNKDGTPGKFTAGAPSMFLSFGEKPDWTKVRPGWVAK